MRMIARTSLMAALAVSSLVVAPAAHADQDVTVGSPGCEFHASTGTVVIGPGGVTFSSPPGVTWDTSECFKK